MPRFILTRAAVKKIHGAIDDLFARVRARLLGRPVGAKTLVFGQRPVQHREDLSIPGIFDAASRSQGMAPNERLRGALSDVVEQYVHAHSEMTKARVVHAVQSFIHEAEASGKSLDAGTVLGGQLALEMGRVTRDLRRLADTEATRAKNLGAVDAVAKVSAALGVSDPTVAFLGPLDGHTCSECQRLFFLEDAVTPRCWKMSEVGHQYHHRGDDHPAIGGLHPHCRHNLVMISIGYGFRAGRLEYIEPGWDELAHQRDD